MLLRRYLRLQRCSQMPVCADARGGLPARCGGLIARQSELKVHTHAHIHEENLEKNAKIPTWCTLARRVAGLVHDIPG